jgi:hypothetical protein
MSRDGDMGTGRTREETNGGYPFRERRSTVYRDSHKRYYGTFIGDVVQERKQR